MSAEKAVDMTDEQGASLGVALTLFIGLLVPLVAGALACGKLARSQRYVVDLALFRPTPGDELVASETIEAVLRREVFDDRRCSIFSSDLNLQVRQAYESSPWVRHVTGIERVFPNQLRIEVEWRQPLAAVEHGGRYLLVDDRGQLLPAESDAPLIDAPIITTRANSVDDVVERGMTDAWILEAIDHGTSVINELLDHGDFTVIEQVSLSHIDVSNHALRLDPKASEVSLVTDTVYADTASGGAARPVVIRWGRSHNHRLGAIELSVATKLKNLASILAVRPNLIGVKVVDVRFDPPHWR